MFKYSISKHYVLRDLPSQVLHEVRDFLDGGRLILEKVVYIIGQILHYNVNCLFESAWRDKGQCLDVPEIKCIELVKVCFDA
jgi:hypothetical protein